MRAERQQYEYYCDVVQTGHFDALRANMNDMGRKGWRLAHVVPHTGGFAQHGDLLLVWERPLATPSAEDGRWELPSEDLTDG